MPAGEHCWLHPASHKHIDSGTLCLPLSFAMRMTGGALAMLIRIELFQPELQIVSTPHVGQTASNCFICAHSISVGVQPPHAISRLDSIPAFFKCVSFMS